MVYSIDLKNRMQNIKHEGNKAKELTEQYKNDFKKILEDGLKEAHLDKLVQFDASLINLNGNTKTIVGVLEIKDTYNIDFPYRYAFYRILENNVLSKVEESISGISMKIANDLINYSVIDYVDMANKIFKEYNSSILDYSKIVK